jgi:hypothetical protein
LANFAKRSLIKWYVAWRAAPAAMRSGVLATAVWLILFCAYCCSDWSNIRELRPNEIGDVAAGASAPLAFLWLVVAVFLQKDELRLQRQEIKQSRLTLELQTEELNHLVTQTAKQTLHLEREWTRSESESYFKWLSIDLEELWACIQTWDMDAILTKDEFASEVHSDVSGANAWFQDKFRSLRIEDILNQSADSRRAWEAKRFASAANRFCQTFELIDDAAKSKDLISVLNRLNQEGWVVTANLVRPFAKQEA